MYKLTYSFKYCYTNETSKICGGTAATPEDLCGFFDGLIPWDEYYKLIESRPSIKEVLKIAKEIYKNEEGLYRIEIVNIKTNETIDFIEF